MPWATAFCDSQCSRIFTVVGVILLGNLGGIALFHKTKPCPIQAIVCDFLHHGLDLTQKSPGQG